MEGPSVALHRSRVGLIGSVLQLLQSVPGGLYLVALGDEGHGLDAQFALLGRAGIGDSHKCNSSVWMDDRPYNCLHGHLNFRENQKEKARKCLGCSSKNIRSIRS